ncbi:metallophosphoesterase MPPED2 [Patella vulgata]|uniref:metallophosphoesterase MPPED2 n=1 Tax=Patella vulgata TaxID=6465 RepID=UPI0024A81FD3|nr:metallophosphoesterase MPPED2 [Patella vulgata]
MMAKIFSKKPLFASELRKEDGIKYKKLELKAIDTARPVSSDKLRFVCISDTHDWFLRMIERRKIPDGDVLLHAGDITMDGDPVSINDFNRLLPQLPHKVKVVIGGNHDLCLDQQLLDTNNQYCVKRFELDTYKSDIKSYVRSKTQLHDKTEARHLFTNCIYLESSMVDICGVKIFGAPWNVKHARYWAFSRERGDPLLEKWNQIPENVDILMTHSPPFGYGDKSSKHSHVGCVDLLNVVQNVVKPKYHIYGHIHEDYGIRTDGETIFINAANCTKSYRLMNRPIVFDYTLPEGHSKAELLQPMLWKKPDYSN